MSLPLKGVRVLAVEHFLSGPYGTMLFGDWGAEIIRIERPGTGDAMRHTVQAREDGETIPLTWLIRNRNKKSITLELKTQKGKEIFLGLVKQADVVWENLAPGTMEKMGLGYEVLRKANNRIIYATVTGFGHKDVLPSPFSERPALDYIAQAMSGLMWAPSYGTKPMWLGISLTDQVPGVMAAMGVLLALYQRQQTGEGQRLDISMYDVGAMLAERPLGMQAGLGSTPSNESESTNQLGPFTAKDGWVAVGVVNNATWPAFCKMVGLNHLADDPEYVTLKQRMGKFDAVIKPSVAQWISTQTRDEVITKLLSLEIPVGPIQTYKEVLDCPHIKARKMLVTTDSEFGPITSIGNPVRLDKEPMPANPPPKLGEHTDAVLRDLLKMSPDQIKALHNEKIV